jgi:hypothetical protein
MVSIYKRVRFSSSPLKDADQTSLSIVAIMCVSMQHFAHVDALKDLYQAVLNHIR